MPSSQNHLPYHSAFASFYDRHFGGHSLELAPRLLRFWAQQELPLKNILDLGCGTGHLALPLLEAGYQVTGLDLSDPMLEQAMARCVRFLPQGQARFLKDDIVLFHLEGPFGGVVSSYNTMNHLETSERLRSCFRGVRKVLHPQGSFLFDFHTLQGLKGWTRSEKNGSGEDQVEVTGGFKAAQGSAWMSLKGRSERGPFETKIWNYSFPLSQVTQWLHEEGFTRVSISGFEELGKFLADPETLDRVLFITHP
jgi:SAM-dependent methyltransferase